MIDQGEKQSRDHHGAVEDGGVAKAEVIEEPARLGCDDDSEQIDKEDASQLCRVQTERCGGKVEVGVGKASYQREERGSAHAEIGQQPRITQMFLGMVPNLLQVFGGHKVLCQRKPGADHKRADQVERRKYQEGEAPLPVRG